MRVVSGPAWCGFANLWEREVRIKRSVLSVALSGLLTTMALSAADVASAQEATAGEGKTGDPGSWVDDEFKADWGLAAINAQYAYARGLSGKGIRLGVFDSGVGADHAEFAGKDLRSIRMADPGCTSEDILAGPEAPGPASALPARPAGRAGRSS